MIIILLIFIFFSFRKFEKTVLTTASTLLFLPHLLSGIPGVKLLYGVCILQIIIFIFNRKKYNSPTEYPKEILYPCLLASIGYIISNLQGKINHIEISIINILCFFVYPYVVWKILYNKKNFNYFLKSLFTFFVIVGLYTCIEILSGKNYFTEIGTKFGIIEESFILTESSERFGLLRCNSFLPWSSSLGMSCSFIFFLILLIKSYQLSPPKYITTSLIILMPLCVLFCGTRSQMVVFISCVIPLLLSKRFIKSKTSKYIYILFTIAIIIALPLLSTIIDSIINSNNTSVEGSSSDLRTRQFEICLPYFLESPIWGYGKNAIWEYVRANNPALLGAESIIFVQMIDYGIVGCITYLLICLGCSKVLWKKSPISSILPLSFLIGKILSTVIGIELSFLILITITILKLNDFYVLQK